MKRHYILLLTALLLQTTPVWACGGDDDEVRDQRQVQHKQCHIRILLRPASGIQDMATEAEEQQLQLPLVTLVLHPNPSISSARKVNPTTQPALVERVDDYSNIPPMDYCTYYQQTAANPDLAPFIRAFPNLTSDTAVNVRINAFVQPPINGNDWGYEQGKVEKEVTQEAEGIHPFAFGNQQPNQPDCDDPEVDQYIGLVWEDIDEANAIQAAI